MARPDLGKPEWVKRLTRARARSALLVLLAYCDHQDCPTREIELYVKDHDDKLLAVVQRRGVACPVCKRPALYHGVSTLAEHEAVLDAQARRSVNRQIWERDHGALIPFDVILDDSLPPCRAEDVHRGTSSVQ